MNQAKYWVWLSMIFGAGNRRIWEAMMPFTRPESAYEELCSGSLDDRLSERELQNISATGIGTAENFITFCADKGIKVVTYSDDEYPPQLRNILNPPAVLYYKGNISCLAGARAVTSVGTRRASRYSIEAAQKICGKLASDGIVIASGFAIGIDIASHLAAADTGRPTAVVLGCGVDVDYPRDNIVYREKILGSGGVFISEYPPGTPPHSQNFPKRNRVLAALGRAAIVFEASSKSGSLITATLAADEGREVFCLPPADIFDSRFSGNISLLRDGARMLLSADDVMECFRLTSADEWDLYTDMPQTVSHFGVSGLTAVRKRKNEGKDGALRDPKQRKRGDLSPVADKIDRKKENTEDKKSKEINLEDFNEIQRKILEIIGDGETHADIIMQKAGIDSTELLLEMTELEISGAVVSLPGKMYRRNI